MTIELVTKSSHGGVVSLQAFGVVESIFRFCHLTAFAHLHWLER